MDVSPGRRPRGYWFPLAMLGVIVLGASPLYWQAFPGCPGGEACGLVVARVGWSALRRTGLAPLLPWSGAWVGLYWLVTIPVAFALTLVFLGRRRRQRRVGIAALGSLVVTVASLGLVVVAGSLLPADFTYRGFVALVIIALGLLVLGGLDRSPALLGFALAFLVLSLTACLYDWSNVASFGSSPGAEALPNVILPGLALLLGAMVFWLLDRTGVRPDGGH